MQGEHVQTKGQWEDTCMCSNGGGISSDRRTLYCSKKVLASVASAQLGFFSASQLFVTENVVINVMV